MDSLLLGLLGGFWVLAAIGVACLISIAFDLAAIREKPQK